MTEKEKAAAGELYRPADKELYDEFLHARDVCFSVNTMSPRNAKERMAILKELLGEVGNNCYFEIPVYFDYGYNTFIGNDFYSNSNLTILDSARVTIGNHVFIGPHVGIYCPQHPNDALTRNKGLEYGFPIAIGNDVWIGGSSCILPGVTIGDDVVIGAGSVVVHDIPSHCLAAGNPCRVIRSFV